MNPRPIAPGQLRARWEALRLSQPKTRIRDAAAALGVSEVELLATGCGENVTRLGIEGGPEGWGTLLKQVEGLGRVMALTRNEHAVHERKGRYQGMERFGAMGSVVGPDIDLRIFFNQWRSAFAVNEPAEGGPRQSLQFFGADGSALHKIYLQPESDRGAWSRLVEQFHAGDQSPLQVVEPVAAKPLDPEDESVDVPAFREAWRALQDTHEFFGLLRQFKVGRRQALRLAGEDLARPVALESAALLLEGAAARQVPIMVFVGNPGIIQIHTGPVHNVLPAHGWLNVLDPDFNLHLRQSALGSAWVVSKPTRDGFVTSLELFDKAGEFVIQFFGRRKGGESELTAWRELTDGLPAAVAA